MNTVCDQDRQRENAYAFIRRAVITRSVPPGNVIDIHDVAERTMADVALVRQAVDMLVRESWLTPAPGGQAHVAHVTLQDAEEVMDMRRALEGLIVERVLPRLGRKQFAYLDALLGQHERLVTNPAAEEEFLAVDRSFHLYLAGLAGNSRLSAFMHLTMDLYARLGVDYVRAQRRIAPCLLEHAAIVTALRQADCLAAKDAVRKHLDRTQDALRTYLDKE